MSQTTLAYEQLIEKFVAWARTCPDIHAAIVVGSRARADRPADEWSDLDIAMFVTDPEPYLTRPDWLNNMGDVRITFVEPTMGGDMERRVLFNGGLDVDFSLIPYAKMKQMIQHGLPPELAGIVRRGIRVLLDRGGLAASLNLADTEGASPASPAQAEFLNAINDFWYHAVLTAKKLRRGELWYAKACTDGYMKRLLLRMIEWHSQTASGGHCDTWHDGRFMERWADRRVLAGLCDAFAHYDQDDIRRALLATMDLFRWLAEEIAERLAYRYPTHTDEYAVKLVSTLLPAEVQTDTGDDT